jgi:hypothetical protein
MTMKILVACEESQAVTIELRKLGHEAYSCDIIPCSGGHPEWHIQQDVLPLLNGNCRFNTVEGVEHRITGKWDMIIAFPPCTKTTNAGARHLFAGGKLNIPRYFDGLCGKALFEAIRHADCDRIAVENPTPSAIYEYPTPSQAIQPYEYGHEATKRTCLWLKGLPLLKPTNVVPRPKYREFKQANGKTRKTCWEMEQGGGKNRAKNRAKTFPGIARAMAEQWADKAEIER